MPDKRDIVDRLQAPHGYFGRTMRAQAAAEIIKLRSALEPFADTARQWQDGVNLLPYPDSYLVTVTYGELRAAKEALDD